MLGPLTKMNESDCSQTEAQEWTDLGKLAKSEVSAQLVMDFCIRQ